MSAFVVARSQALHLNPLPSSIGVRSWSESAAALLSAIYCPTSTAGPAPLVYRLGQRFRLSQIRFHGIQTVPVYGMPPHKQDEVQSSSLGDPESFWAHHAEQLHWHKLPSRIIQQTTKKLPSGTNHGHWTWFPDGEISTVYNCIDRHVNNGQGDNVAIIWDSPVTNKKEKYTYNQLLDEVVTLAGVLREEGVKKGDVVLVYSKETCQSSHGKVLI
jgi:Acetyl-coenzyme A synthetase N-terminus/AMP-binding enzyme